MDPVCQSKGAQQVLEALKKELVKTGLDKEVRVLETPRIGGCDQGPEIMVYPDEVRYAGIKVEDVPFLGACFPVSCRRWKSMKTRN